MRFDVDSTDVDVLSKSSLSILNISIVVFVGKPINMAKDDTIKRKYRK